VRSEDHIEAAGEPLGQLVEIAVHEGGRHPHPGGEGARGGDGGLREVGPRDGGTVSRPADRVHPEVALQVEERLALHVSGTGARDRIEVATAAGGEVLDAVELGREIDMRPHLPQTPVGREILVH
jgi:hypothetical protein